MRLNLVVIRVVDRERAKAFYEQIGLAFVEHRHGSGAEHYSCEQDGVVFEIYPRQNSDDNTSATRLGFVVASLDATVSRLQESGAIIVTTPKASPWGRRAVVDAPDGHRIELTER